MRCLIIMCLCICAEVVLAQQSPSHIQLVEKATADISAKDYKSARATLSKIDTNQLSNKDIYKGLYFQQLARLAYYDTYEDEKAVNFYYRAINIFENARSEKDISIASSNLSGILTDLKRYEEAERFIKRSMPYMKTDPVKYGNTLINYARLKAAMGNYEIATQYNLEALKNYEKVGDQTKIAQGYFQLGLNLDYSHQYEKSLNYYQKSLDIRKQLKDTLGMCNVLNNMGVVSKNLLRYDEAFKHYDQSQVLAKKYHRPALQVNPLINMAVIEGRKKNYPKSISYYLEGLEIAKKYNRNADITVIESNLSSVYLNNKEYAKALELAKKTYDQKYDKATLEEKIQFNFNLAEIMEVMGNPKDAYPYLQKSYLLRDSLYSQQGSKAIAEMATKYETEKKENQIALLDKTNRLQQSDLLNKSLFIDKQNLELDKRALEISYRDANIRVKQSEIENQQFLSREQRQKIDLLNKEKEIQQLEVERKNSYLIISFFTLLLVIFGAFQYYRKRKLQEKNNLQNEKLRISRELHDNIGSQLTFINNSIQSFKLENGEALRLNEAQNITLNTIRELRRTVWLINQPQFALDEFIIKLQEYIKPLQTGKPIIEIKHDDSQKILQPIIATNLFRIIQEVINNAIKFADAKHIELNFNGDSTRLNLEIKDDGKGFDLEKSSEGYGIKNIKSRVTDLNGKVAIQSEQSFGTKYKFSIPIN